MVVQNHFEVDTTCCRKCNMLYFLKIK